MDLELWKLLVLRDHPAAHFTEVKAPQQLVYAHTGPCADCGVVGQYLECGGWSIEEQPSVRHEPHAVEPNLEY